MAARTETRKGKRYQNRDDLANRKANSYFCHTIFD